MKRAELLFNLLAIPLDAAMVIASAVFAYFLRIKFAYIWPIVFEINPFDYIRTIILIIPFFLVVLAVYGLYSVRSTDRLGPELLKIFAAVATALMVVILIFFFDRNVFPSRLIVLISGAITLVMLMAGRIILRFIRDGQLKRGHGAHRLVISQGPKSDARILDSIKKIPSLGYKVAGVLDSTSPDLLKQLDELHSQNRVDEFLQIDPDMTSLKSAELVIFCHDRGIKFNFVPNIFEVSTRRMEVEMISDSPIIKLKGTPLDGWGRVVKRTSDLLASGLALVFLSPIFLAVYIAVRLESPGRAIYVAPRAGYGREFTFYKFRSMQTHLSTGQGYGGEVADALREKLTKESSIRPGFIPKIANDPRVTRVGRFIRKAKLDELPQFWNVLKGDMSLVGPRAHILDEVSNYKDKHLRLFTIKPGLTGLTQIAQMQNPSLSFEEEVRLDLYYIENWSLWGDIKIIFKTAWLLLTGRLSSQNE